MIRQAGIVLAVVALAAPVAAAQTLRLDRWAGVYKHDFANGDVTGRSYISENILEIVELSPKTAYIRTHLEFYNGHLCSLWGVADVVGDQLVYRSKPTTHAPPCVFRLTREGARLVIHDDLTCKADCGERGAFEGVAFPVSARRPIRYMARLKASREFAAATAERAGSR